MSSIFQYTYLSPLWLNLVPGIFLNPHTKICLMRERERERERDQCEKHFLVAFRVHLDWGTNLQPRYVP